MDKGVKSFYLSQYANNLNGGASASTLNDQTTNPDMLVLKGLPSVYDKQGRSTSEQPPTNRN
jgi:hypothetical protein